ncbi:uncharacterized protein G2W53_007415 [Senna tora]|uniref:Uncharacterized protein n=1 Tax=Senna tora TaxID=362788 RepID=A0A834X7J2_9FABA|nr:uncharacterized protein G2W53_007415 [Senna tora]
MLSLIASIACFLRPLAWTRTYTWIENFVMMNKTTINQLWRAIPKLVPLLLTYRNNITEGFLVSCEEHREHRAVSTPSPCCRLPSKFERVRSTSTPLRPNLASEARGSLEFFLCLWTFNPQPPWKLQPKLPSSLPTTHCHRLKPQSPSPSFTHSNPNLHRSSNQNSHSSQPTAHRHHRSLDLHRHHSRIRTPTSIAAPTKTRIAVSPPPTATIEASIFIATVHTFEPQPPSQLQPKLTSQSAHRPPPPIEASIFIATIHGKENRN